MNCRRCALWLLGLSVLMPAAYGEAVYVIEQLVVGVTSGPGADSERIGQVKSGEKLELLDAQGDAAHVRLPNGQEGWIKASYVSAEEPLQVRLAARSAELEKLKQEDERLKHEAERVKQEDERLKQDVSRLQSELAAARTAHTPAAPPAGATPVGATGSPPVPESATAPPGAAASPPTPIRETVFLRSPDKPGQTSWSFVLAIGFLMLLVGFVLGWKTLDRRIRQKYGGLRIY